MFEQAELHETLAGGEDGLFIGTRRPTEDAPGLCVGGILVLAEFGEDLLDRGIGEGGKTDGPVGQLAGWNTFRRRPCTV